MYVNLRKKDVKTATESQGVDNIAQFKTLLSRREKIKLI
jgi:hypothetical protein